MRERIEASLERWGRLIARHPLLAIALSLTLSGSFAAQLPQLGIETAVETFLRKDDPARVEYDTFREQFGRQDLILIAIQPPDVFDVAFLRKLRSMHEEIEEQVPHVDEVQSLVNARSTRGAASELIVEDLLEELPETPEQLARLRERVMSTPIYVNTLVSEDASFTSLIVTLDLYSSTGEIGDDALSGFDDQPAAQAELSYLSGDEIGDSLAVIDEIVRRYRADDFRLEVAGAPALANAVTHSMMRDLRRFIGVMVAAIAVVLFAMFRRISAVILPLGIVILSLLTTLGMMAASGIPMSPPTQVLPTFLLAVGTGAAVHILKIFYMRFDAGDSVDDAIGYAFRHSGLPVIMTGLTTAGGLLSFLAAELNPIVHLGTFGPLGVVLALIYCLVLLPALLAVVPIRPRPATGSSGNRLERLVVDAGDFSVTHPYSMVAATVLLIASSLTGVVRLQFGNDVMSWLLPSDPLRRATEVIDQHLKGSITLEVLADTGQVDGIKDPRFMNGLEDLRKRSHTWVRGDRLFVGKTIAISDILKEIHQALNENRADFYAIPQGRPLIAQELLLFENTGTDDLEDVVDSQFQIARFTLRVPYTDPMRYGGFIDEVEAQFREVFDDDAIRISTTGFMAMMGRTLDHVISGMSRSYVLAILIITPLMMLLIGNLRAGLVSMVPNITPILITLGLMGWMGVTIDMFTMMIGGIAIGLVVDDTIHFIHGFQRNFSRSGDARQSVRETLETTGRALLVTSVVLSIGFLVFIFSGMQNLYYFGLLTSFTIACAFLIDILVTPALMVLVTRRR